MKKRFEPKTQSHGASDIAEERPASEISTHWRSRMVPRKTSAKQISGRIAPKESAPPLDQRAATAKPKELKMFQRILVPIDFSTESTRALKFAATLAKREGGDITLVHVVGPIHDLRDFGYGPVQHRRPNEGLLRHARQRLRALGRRHLQPNMEWRSVVRSGTGPNQILKEAAEMKAGVIVMPTRGLSHAPPTEIGSTAERVVRHSPCPVLILPGRKPAKRSAR